MNKDYFEGFIAAALHDIGKLALKNNQWEHHANLMEISTRIGKISTKNGQEINSSNLLGQRIIDLISIHHEKNNDHERKLFDFSDLSCVEYALILSDRVQSSMLPSEEDFDDISEENLENLSKEDFNRLKSNEKYFNPFYGNVIKWNDTYSASVLNEFFSELNNMGEFEANQKTWANNIFSLQKKLLIRYPFLTFIPHLSLKLHLQLSSILFLFLYEEAQEYSSDLKQMKEFKFYTFEVSPNFSEMFYRLRDIGGFHSVMEKFSNNLVNKLYGKYHKELHGVPNKKSNPFLFYNEDTFVFLHTSFEIVSETLQKALDELNLLYSISVKVSEHKFEINIERPDDRINEMIKVKNSFSGQRSFTISSSRIFDYDIYSKNICMACGRPINPNQEKEDDKGNILCDLCYNPRKISTGYDLDIFGEAGERLSYIFLIMPEDLISHSKEIAESLIEHFLAESKIKPYSIYPTETGLLEYLQALDAISIFQQEIQQYIDRNSILFSSPKLTCYLLKENENQPWDFLRYLNSKRSELKLDISLILITCNKKTPFWSLMESIQEYNKFKSDVFYDISGGCITMFNPEEVTKIRNLAELAAKNNIAPTQMQNFSEVALGYSKDELLLEIEIRMNNRKSFLTELQNGINMLKFEESSQEYEKRLKRAVFLKYIGKLIQNKNSPRRW